MMTITTIKQLSEILNEREYTYYGLRKATDTDLELIESGRDYLNRSHVWDCGDMTDELLSGTCGIYVDSDMDEDELTDRYEHTDRTYYGDTILLIADNTSEWGEDDHEIILGDDCGADVVAIIKIA